MGNKSKYSLFIASSPCTAGPSGASLRSGGVIGGSILGLCFKNQIEKRRKRRPSEVTVTCHQFTNVNTTVEVARYIENAGWNIILLDRIWFWFIRFPDTITYASTLSLDMGRAIEGAYVQGDRWALNKRLKKRSGTILSWRPSEELTPLFRS